MKPADKDDEFLAILDENGKFTGKYDKRGIVHSNQLFHNEIALWIIDKDKRQVLLQRRSPNKKQNPNKLALCAGHVVNDESVDDALRKEALEEIGLNLEKYDVKELITIKRTEPNNYCFSHHYYTIAKIPVNEFVIQKEELSEVLYMDYEELKQLVKENSDQIVFKWNEAYKKLFNKLDEIIYE